MSNFLQRLTWGGVLSALLFLVIYFSHHPLIQPLFVLFSGIFICGALWEYYSISRVNGSMPVAAIGIIGSICYIYIVYMATGNPALADWALITLGLILFSAFLSYFFAGMSPFSNLAVTMFGVMYLTIPLAFFIPINLIYGRIWMLYLLLVAKLTDVGAYLVGKQWGRHLMAPVISPKKTWEGALGGFLIGTLTSYGVHKIAGLYGVDLFESSLQSIWFGALMSIIAQIGDLSESLLKRDSGVKDSNRLPGLGGMLDMVDSLVFTTPLLYFFLKLYLDKT
jgi:phosphatidate cytidylyltransferase